MSYAGNDPDKRVPEVFMQLMQDLRDLNTFDGYYQAYLIAQDPKDARMAQRLASSDAHKAKLENLAVATLADKGRLFDFDLKPSVGRVKESEDSCWFACRYNFWATRDVFAKLTVRQRRDSPIKLRHGKYRVTFAGSLNLPKWQIRESNWHGDYDGPDKETEKFTQQVIFELGQTKAETEFKVGNITLATFERGSAGGYHGIWATADPTITLSIKSVELIP